jgi:ABC-type multidrug transport system fused ATPase/permease subunit
MNTNNSAIDVITGSLSSLDPENIINSITAIFKAIGSANTFQLILMVIALLLCLLLILSFVLIRYFLAKDFRERAAEKKRIENQERDAKINEALQKQTEIDLYKTDNAEIQKDLLQFEKCLNANMGQTTPDYSTITCKVNPVDRKDVMAIIIDKNLLIKSKVSKIGAIIHKDF